MKKKHILTAFILSLCLFSIPILSVSASGYSPDEYNSMVEQYAQELEEKYYINIEYPIRSDNYSAIGTATLATLDTALSYLSRSFVRQLSLFFKKEYGNALTFEYSYLPADYAKRDIAALGYFTSDNSTIQLFIPTKGADMTLTGNSPVTILHEIGHAYHLFLSNKHGRVELMKDWSDCNNGYGYGSFTENPDNRTFISHYATLSYEEDFAETFAYTFSCNRAGLGISDRLQTSQMSPTGLGKKVTFLKKIIPTYFDNTYTTIRNLEEVYKASPTLYYKGFYLSGNSLEYAGYNEPNGIIDTILSNLKISAHSVEWVREVGGWKVQDTEGGKYIIFPGCGYVTIRIPAK